jgi:ubiquinone/menaquinone biosynthesis C-methylase UbiE
MSKQPDNYFYNQTVLGKSHEDDNPIWSKGQIRFIDYVKGFLSPSSKVLDCACGDGIGLAELSRLGHEPFGMDISEEKLSRASEKGQSVKFGDMQKISDFPDIVFDAVMSSHTLEHAHNPKAAVDNFKKVLKPKGKLFIVLPFPDPGSWNDDIHIGKYALHTDGENEEQVISFFTDNGFSVLDKKRDSYREPEIWIVLEKN